MARGWESKAVEDQLQVQEAADSKSQRHSLPAPDPEWRRRREILLLSRVRVQRELEVSQNPRYRDQLTRALADIEAQLAALDDSR